MRSTSAVLFVLAAGLSLGCGPSPECKQYINCQKAYDATVDTSAYGDGGACWTTLETADACTAQCKEATAAIAATPGAPAACLAAASTTR
jgi:hypothetical protein